ncbi:ArsR/SmtB family transcription factor, partial [Primorskyibacter sedentarius]
ISAQLDVRQNTMSANLSILARAGLVRNERQGRGIRYFADMRGMGGLLSFLLEDCCGGNPEMCRPFLDDIACSCMGKAHGP